MKEKLNQGFTLFELLVVVSIIGLLVATGTVSYSSAQKRARDAKRKEDLKSLQTALEQYYTVAGQYPTSCYSSGSLTYGSDTFLEAFPADPKGGSEYQYTTCGTCDASGYCYQAHMERAGGGNAYSGCSQTPPVAGATKDYFCIKNQQ